MSDEHNPVAIRAETGTAMISRVMETAISAGNPEVLSQLMTLQERYDARESGREFNDALAMAKEDLPIIPKNNLVGYRHKDGSGETGYRHEDLGTIAAMVNPILSRNGLSYRWRSSMAGATLTVTCVLSHRRGHSEETSLSAPADMSGKKNPHQAIASALTYLQRYTLKCALGLAAGNDDDGRGGVVDEPLVTPAQADELALIGNRANVNWPAFFAWAKDRLGWTAKSVHEIRAADYEVAKTAMNKKRPEPSDQAPEEAEPTQYGVDFGSGGNPEAKQGTIVAQRYTGAPMTPFQKGQRAFISGLRSDNNPYPKAKPEHTAWREGFLDAQGPEVDADMGFDVETEEVNENG